MWRASSIEDALHDPGVLASVSALEATRIGIMEPPSNEYLR
jgi:hypothetical protein